MTDKQIAAWIKTNLGPTIEQAIAAAKNKNPKLLYTPEHLGGMAQREVGFLIDRYVKQGMPFALICEHMRGDFTQRKGETEAQYHGYSFWQIDIDSYPDFVKSGLWKNPFAACSKAIAVLEEKRLWLEQHLPALTGDAKLQAITAAYNCGEGNVFKALIAKADVDSRTYNHDYSKEAFRFKQLYQSC